MNAKRPGIVADHGGCALKERRLVHLHVAGHETIDFGADFLEAPHDFVIPLARALAAGKIQKGVASCGSGVQPGDAPGHRLGEVAALEAGRREARAVKGRRTSRVAGMIELLIADVDGTLVTPDKVLTERARTAVRKLREANIRFAITSGRPPRGMVMLVEPLGLTTPIAGFNGGMFVKPDMTPIGLKTLPEALVGPVLRAIGDHRLDAWVYQGRDWFVRDPAAPHVAREQHNVQFPPTVTTDLGRHDKGVVKIVGVSDDLPAVEACAQSLRDRFGDEISAARSQPHYVDVTHPQANKGEVVRSLSKTLEVPMERIATIGDMPNDVLMFAVSGLGIAMGNASPDVRRTARRVTRSNTEDGFAEAVERFVLPKQRHS